MLYLLSYILILLGSFSVTAGILGRFTYRRRLIFDLKLLQRWLAVAAGVLALVFSIVLYSTIRSMA